MRGAGVIALAAAFRENGLSAVDELIVHEDGAPEAALAELIFSLRRPDSQAPMRKLQIGSLLCAVPVELTDPTACLDAKACAAFFHRPLTHCVLNSDQLDVLAECVREQRVTSLPPYIRTDSTMLVQ